jgi:hypothetical protein
VEPDSHRTLIGKKFPLLKIKRGFRGSYDPTPPYSVHNPLIPPYLKREIQEEILRPSAEGIFAMKDA